MRDIPCILRYNQNNSNNIRVCTMPCVITAITARAYQREDNDV